MIKSQEQYDEMFRVTSYSGYFKRFVPGGWGVIQIEDAQQTIEALRNVARAARDCVYGKEPLSVDEADMKGQLDALPEWVLEDERP